MRIGTADHARREGSSRRLRQGRAAEFGKSESAMQQDPLSGSLFVFLNRRRDRLKILYWGQTGFCIWYQQLEKGTYQLPEEPREEQEAMEVSRSQLSLILDGIDLSSVRQRRRFQSLRERPCREEATRC